jgi:hypothetical protein
MDVDLVAGLPEGVNIREKVRAGRQAILIIN